MNGEEPFRYVTEKEQYKELFLHKGALSPLIPVHSLRSHNTF